MGEKGAREKRGVKGVAIIGWRDKKTATWSPILKCHFEMLLFAWSQVLRKCSLLPLNGQANKNKNTFLKLAPGEMSFLIIFFNAKNEKKLGQKRFGPLFFGVYTVKQTLTILNLKMFFLAIVL